eukprot:scaffold7052_cov254-Pinguiococcus_pyrenoidosus.AAC.120
MTHTHDAALRAALHSTAAARDRDHHRGAKAACRGRERMSSRERWMMVKDLAGIAKRGRMILADFARFPFTRSQVWEEGLHRVQEPSHTYPSTATGGLSRSRRLRCRRAGKSRTP